MCIILHKHSVFVDNNKHLVSSCLVTKLKIAQNNCFVYCAKSRFIVSNKCQYSLILAIIRYSHYHYSNKNKEPPHLSFEMGRAWCLISTYY